MIATQAIIVEGAEQAFVKLRTLLIVHPQLLLQDRTNIFIYPPWALLASFALDCMPQHALSVGESDAIIDNDYPNTNCISRKIFYVTVLSDTIRYNFTCPLHWCDEVMLQHSV